MAEEATLRTEPRSITGSAVKRLRRAGVLPCNVYGRGIESITIQTPLAELQRVFRSVDRNAVVQMAIDGREGTLPVVLREVQRHPVSGQLLHADFYQVDLDRPIHSEARVLLIGDAEAVALGGTLVQSLEYLMLEALPLEMPSEIEVNVGGLSEFGSSVLVRDITLPEGVRAMADEAVAIATVLAPRLVEEEEEEGIEGLEAPEGETPEGEAPAADADPSADGES